MFKEEGLHPTFHVVNTGEEAVDFLHQRGAYNDAAQPDAILLDWHLPRMTGAEMLTALEDSRALEDIPIIVLTGSQTELSVLQEDSPDPDSYIRKPIDIDEFADAMRSFDESETSTDDGTPRCFD